MTRIPDEIKKGLECCTVEGEFRDCDNCPYMKDIECQEETRRDALALIQQLEAVAKSTEQIRWERDIAIGQLKELGLSLGEKVDGKVTRWISVEERLLEDDVNVLIYAVSNGDEVDSCIAMTSYTHHMHGFNIEGWHPPWQYFFFDYMITHWMPLPNRRRRNDHEGIPDPLHQ